MAAADAVRRALHNDHRLLAHLGEHYNTYSDIGGLTARFKLADLQYPGSRFILTVRDIDDWIDSRRRHVQRNQARLEKGIYAGANLIVDERSWREEYEAFVQRVGDHFASRDDDLLVLDICGGDGWERLAPFLGVVTPPGPFPTENLKDRDLDRAHPFLVRRSDDEVVLVEGTRYRTVPAAATAGALAAVLGRPVQVARGVLDQADVATGAAVLLPAGGLQGLARTRRSRLALVGPTGNHTGRLRRHVHRLTTGQGAASPWTQLRDVRATHLIISADPAGWLSTNPEVGAHLRDHTLVVGCNEAGVLWRLARPGPWWRRPRSDAPPSVDQS